MAKGRAVIRHGVVALSLVLAALLAPMSAMAATAYPSRSVLPYTIFPNSVCLDAANQDTCLTRSSAGILSLSTGSAFYAPSGSAGAPAYSFISATTVGLYLFGSIPTIVANQLDINSDTSNYNALQFYPGSSATASVLADWRQAGNMNATSGTQTGYRFEAASFTPGSGTPTNVALLIAPTINWGGTPGAGSYEALRIAVTETSLPTGSNYLVRLLAGSGGTTFRGGIRNTGQWESGGTAPGVSACGTTPAIVGTDVSGKVTVGTGVTTSCTVTFANTWANAPPCTVSGDNTAVTYIATSSTTVLTLTSSADMASDVLSYICLGRA